MKLAREDQEKKNKNLSLHLELSFFNNNNIYLLQLGCHPVAAVILHVYKI